MRTLIVAAVVVLAMGGGFLAWRLTRPPTTLPQASCGHAVTHQLASNTQILGADRGALRCFRTAVRTCRSGSLEVTEMGVDTGTDYVFVLEPGGTRCQVNELSQDYSANFGGWTGPIISTSCYRTTVDRMGAVLRCARQDVLIPAAVTRVPVTG